MRNFDTGATRDTDTGKLDYEGFLCPLVLEEYARYMNKHRIQADGNVRDSDNWQKGIPMKVYVKSCWRHFHQIWKLHRGIPTFDEKGNPVTMKEACCAVLFNVMGYLHEFIKAERPVETPAVEGAKIHDGKSSVLHGSF
jgi:hypothetical protein